MKVSLFHERMNAVTCDVPCRRSMTENSQQHSLPAVTPGEATTIGVIVNTTIFRKILVVYTFRFLIYDAYAPPKYPDTW